MLCRVCILIWNLMLCNLLESERARERESERASERVSEWASERESERARERDVDLAIPT